MKASESDYRTVVGVRRENMEKQIGCMSGFLQIFDHHQILAGKRIHTTKRLPSSTVVSGSPETEISGQTREFSRKPEPHNHHSSPAEKLSGRSKSPAKMNDRSKSPAEKMNGRQKSPMKSYKEIHRHSLDSMITVSKTPVSNGDDSQRRSPSVIARLMGLEPMASSDQKSPQTVTKPTLRRSSSESRVSRDLIHSKYIDHNNFQLKQPNKSQNENESVKRIVRDGRNKSESSRTSPWRSRSFFDPTDFFPEPNPRTVTMHEKKLKIRGIDEQSNDLSTLKQILEVLQLRGPLRSTNYSNGNSHRNLVYDRNLHFNESNIVLVKPSKSDYHRSVTDSRRARKYVSENSPAISPKRDGGTVERTGRNPVRVRTSSLNRIESNLKACNSISKTTPKRNGSVHHASISRSPRGPRNQKLTESTSVNPPNQKLATEDESSSISESVFSTPSTTDSEISKGKRSLQRCDKLLTETKSATESPPSSAIVLPSPLSVLDSGFDKDEPSTHSHRIDLKEREEFTSEDADFIYISNIIQATQHLPEDPNVFFSLKKQLYNTENTSNVSKRQRKLIFDIVLEIINRNVKLSPWRQVIDDSGALLKHIWFEFKRIREVSTGDGVLELVNGVIEKDLVEVNEWRVYPIETSEAVLDIERMIFKDFVSEVIRDMIEFSSECRFLKTRRKLVF